MHKCIMVKVGGKIPQNVCKNLVNFPKTGGEICESRGEIIIFEKQGKCIETGKIVGNSKFVVDD